LLKKVSLIQTLTIPISGYGLEQVSALNVLQNGILVSASGDKTIKILG